MQTGYHIAGDNSPVSRVALTLQKALGVSVDSWDKESLQIKPWRLHRETIGTPALSNWW